MFLGMNNPVLCCVVWSHPATTPFFSQPFHDIYLTPQPIAQLEQVIHIVSDLNCDCLTLQMSVVVITPNH